MGVFFNKFVRAIKLYNNKEVYIDASKNTVMISSSKRKEEIGNLQHTPPKVVLNFRGFLYFACENLFKFKTVNL